MPPPMKTSDKEKLFYEKGFERKPLARWDEAWALLSPRARLLFLEEVRGPVRSEKGMLGQPGVPIRNLPPEPLDELLKAKFVFFDETVKSKGVQAFANPELYDFAARARCFRSARLFQPDAGPDALDRYVRWICYEARLEVWVMTLLHDKGVTTLHSSMMSSAGLIGGHRWPNWVVDYLELPRGRQLMDYLIEAKGPVPITKFLRGVSGAEGTKRATLDALIGHLAIFEDFDPVTHDIVVDLLPSVRAGMALAAAEKVLPSFEIVEHPTALGPVEGIFLTDLRAILLEIASEPLRLKQDETPFAKELERLEGGFDPLPAWFDELLAFEGGIVDRIDLAFDLAEDLELAKVHTEGKVVQFRLTAKGQEWLGLEPVAQHLAVYKLYTKPPAERPQNSMVRYTDFGSYDYGDSGPGDIMFLGADLTVIVSDKPKMVHSTREAKAKDRLALRRSLDRAFASIPAGPFYTLKSVTDRLSYPDFNPLLMGANPEKVVIFNGYHRIPMLDEERRNIARQFLQVTSVFRMVTLGCFRVAIGPESEVCVSRTPWYDAYFGREVVVKDLAHSHAIGGSTRVVVQPDFSIVVIGLNPLPLAELAPFCERTTKGSGQGAVILKLTRESILKAMSHGMTSEQILSRLDKHAGQALPANVRREAEEWSRWPRTVQLETLIVLRCPDASTADRVVSAFKSKVERIGDTLIGVTADQVNSASRTKLQAQGLFVGGQLPPKPRVPTVKTRPKRSW